MVCYLPSRTDDGSTGDDVTLTRKPMTDRLEVDGRTKDEPATKDGRPGGSAMDRRSSQKKIARGLSIDSDLSLKSSRTRD